MMKYIFMLLLVLILNKIRENWWLVTMGLSLSSYMFIFEAPTMEKEGLLYSEWGFDFMGFSLIMLSFWVSMLMILSSSLIKNMNFYSHYFLWLVVGLMLVLFMCFISMNLMYFYFFFEISLIPTLLIIMGWGLQLERLQAGVYFMFYTLTASLPLLLNLSLHYSKMGALLFPLILVFLNKYIFSMGMLSWFILFSLIMAFLVKLPIFFVHLWLPKAHVEAPVAGSMILAGVLLKLGGFGLTRVMPLMYLVIMKYSGYMIGVGLMSMTYVGLMCWRLNDLKALVAYSSVSHMGLVFSGLVTLYIWGMSGGLILMISHGLSSSGLFCVVNMFYERLGSRSIFLNKGLLLMFSSMSFMVFMLCAANISAPPTINLMGEIFLMLSVMTFDKIMMIWFPLGSFLGAVFTLFLFSYSQHGKSYMLGSNFLGVSVNDLHCLSLHIIPLNLVILKSEFFFL